MNGILVAKNLERIADHASNIATDVIFWVRGADVRHQLSIVDGLIPAQRYYAADKKAPKARSQTRSGLGAL